MGVNNSLGQLERTLVKRAEGLRGWEAAFHSEPTLPLPPVGPPQASKLPPKLSPEREGPTKGVSQNSLREDPADYLEQIRMGSKRDERDGSPPGGTHLQLLMGRSGAVWVKEQRQSWRCQRSRGAVCHPPNADSIWARPLPAAFLCP